MHIAKGGAIGTATPSAFDRAAFHQPCRPDGSPVSATP